MILALAGRRVDALDTESPKFPLQNVTMVSEAIRNLLSKKAVTAVVTSAACGADLIALSEAGSLGLRRRVVLPFERQRFRAMSVTDRPGDWGPLYDRILDEVTALGDLVVLSGLSDDDAFRAASRAILDDAVSLREKLAEPVGVALVWEGSSRGSDDFTADFGFEAMRRELRLFEVRTL